MIPMKPASFSGERTPEDIGLLSSGRTADTLISGAAAIMSRHGAFEPGTGLRFEFCSMAALSLPIASSMGGMTEAVVRLPPDLMRHRIGDHGAAAGADILDGGAGDEAPIFHL